MTQQDWLVVPFVLVAVGYLGRKLWGTWYGGACSGGCSQCPAKPAGVPLVPLETRLRSQSSDDRT